MYSIGIDIGHSTLKCLLIDTEGSLVREHIVFHHGQGKVCLLNWLTSLHQAFPETHYHLGIIGTQQHLLEKLTVNDLSAYIEGSLKLYPKTASIIEIGAQSARYMTGIVRRDKGDFRFSSNSSCSAGTGSFLEEQVSRLNIDLEAFSTVAEQATQIPRIAGRCSVFSKTDMIHHQQAGCSVPDILMGLSYALVRNYKANVVQQQRIEKPVLFIGGVAKNRGVVKAMEDVFRLDEHGLIIPDECMSIGALGAALIAQNQGQVASMDDLLEQLNQVKKKKVLHLGFPPLNKFGQGDAINKHLCYLPKEASVKAYLGIDIGSTSTNLVLLDDQKNVIDYRYLRTRGEPKIVVEEGIASLKEAFNGDLNILGIGTTGSGRHMIGKVLNADIVVNEITAQAKGTIEQCPEVDTILEIGGQDSKFIKVNDGRVTDFEMNKICAAGTGSFIEEQGKKLNIAIEDYGAIAFKGEAPLNLGDRCTVFIEGNISKAMATGESTANIAAGLSYSIVNNYLNRVVNGKAIGDRVFLQGGIAYNQSVVNAFRSVLGKSVEVPKYFSVTGAYGVALLTKEALATKQETTSVKEESIDMEAAIETLYLQGYDGRINPNKKTVGIPRVLFLHKLFPMFNVFFKTLGYNVLLSDVTNEEIVRLSQESSLDETCYPVKLINGHVASLVQQGIDYLFLPSLYTMKHAVSRTREDYACIYMQTAPKIMAKIMDLEGQGIQLLSPALSFKFGKKYMMKTLLGLGQSLGKNKVQTAMALKKGMARLQAFEKEVEAVGQSVVESLAPDEKAFVVITRAYGIADPGLNMGIPKRLRAMGYKVLTLSNLPAHNYDLFDEYPNMYWPFGQHILSGAKLVKDHPNLYAIYLTNHGCGPDTMIRHYFDDEMGNKPYLNIEVDEHASDVGVITRLEAFVESLKTDHNVMIRAEAGSPFMPLSKALPVVLPYLYPYSQLVAETLKQQGYKASVLPQTNRDSLALGRKMCTSKESLSLVSLLGDVLYFAKKNKEQSGLFYVPRNEGSEATGQYSRLIAQKLKTLGYSHWKVCSPFYEDLLLAPEMGASLDLLYLAGDIIVTAPSSQRPSLLEGCLEKIQLGILDAEYIRSLATSVQSLCKGRDLRKRLLVVGEYNIYHQHFLSQNNLKTMEEVHRLLYAPVSEAMYYLWADYGRKSDNGAISNKLQGLAKLMEDVHEILGVESSFSPDIERLYNETDYTLPMFAGGDGRYRMTKILDGHEGIQGILSVHSMYENTGTILKILRQDHSQLRLPILDVQYDGSAHSNQDSQLKNFVYHLPEAKEKNHERKLQLPMGALAVSMNRISKNYTNVKVIDNISMAIEHKEIVCVLGPSGCGKSTLLNIVSGLTAPSHGHIEKDDVKTGYVFQEDRLLPWKTVYENIHFVQPDRSKKEVMHLINSIGLKGFEDYYPDQLSGGMRQRCAIARAFNYDSGLLLMDEPFKSLDYTLRMEMIEELVKVWKNSPHTILFVTHEIDEALLLGHRIVVLSKRPATVLREYFIDTPQGDRQLNSSELSSLRNEILDVLLTYHSS